MKLSHVFPLQGSCTAERYHRFGCSVFRHRLGAYGGGPTVFVIRFGCRSSWLPIHSPTAVSLLLEAAINDILDKLKSGDELLRSGSIAKTVLGEASRRLSSSQA